MNQPSSPFAVCPSCKRIPSIGLTKNKEYLVHVKCSCSLDEYYSLQEYIQKIKQLEVENKFCSKTDIHNAQKVEGKQYCFSCKAWYCESCLNQHNVWIKNHQLTDNPMKPSKNCKDHIENTKFYYCSNCNDHFCEKCLDKHYKHNIVKLSDVLSFDDLSKIKKEFEDSKKTTKEYNENLAVRFKTKLQSQIKRIDEALNFNKTVNNNISNLIQIFIDNYTLVDCEYNIIENLIGSSNFEKNELEISDDLSLDNINKLVYFFENTTICKRKKVKQDPILLKNIHKPEEITSINSMVILEDGRIAVAGNKVAVYTLQHMKMEYVVTESLSYYLCLSVRGNLLSAENKEISIYEIYDKISKKIGAFIGSEGTILKIVLIDDNRIASCSGTIHIWNSNPPYSEIKKLKGQVSVAAILVLKVKPVLVSNSFSENTLKFWDLTPGSFFSFSSYKCIETIDNVKGNNANGIIEISNNRILVSEPNDVLVIDINTYKILKRVDDLSNILSYYQFSDGTIFCGGSSVIYQIDSYSFGILCQKKGATKGKIPVLLFLRDKSFLSGDLSGEINEWEYIYF